MIELKQNMKTVVQSKENQYKFISQLVENKLEMQSPVASIAFHIMQIIV